MTPIVWLVLLPGAACAKPLSLSPTWWPRSDYDRFIGPVQHTVRTTADAATGTQGAVADAALTTVLTQVALTAGAPISYVGIRSLVYYDAKTGETRTSRHAGHQGAGE